MKYTVMNSSHWSDVKRIYQQGIDTGQATFESTPPDTWQAWLEKFLADLSLVCLEKGKVIGWVAISQVSSRKVYHGVGEISLYIDPDHQGQGVGKKLMEKIISDSERKGFWTLQAGIFLENLASIRLHQDAGFRIVGLREKIGKMSSGPRTGEWRDVLLLERRSKTHHP